MFGNAPPGRAPIRDHERADDAPNVPAALRRDTARQPDLGVESSERLLEVPDPGLHLGHLEDPGRRMECQQVDPPSLPVDAVARLRPDLPTVAPMRLRPRSHQQGMVAIEQRIEVARCAPSDGELALRIECPEHSTNRCDRVTIHAPAFDVRYRRSAQPAAASEVLLPPAAALPKHPDGPTQSRVIHGLIIVGVAYRRLTARFQAQPLEAGPHTRFSPEVAPHRHLTMVDAVPSVSGCLRWRWLELATSRAQRRGSIGWRLPQVTVVGIWQRRERSDADPVETDGRGHAIGLGWCEP
jgi:hypothetical protein